MGAPVLEEQLQATPGPGWGPRADAQGSTGQARGRAPTLVSLGRVQTCPRSSASSVQSNSRDVTYRPRGFINEVPPSEV
jgi:hypothetical protein